MGRQLPSKFLAVVKLSDILFLLKNLRSKRKILDWNPPF